MKISELINETGTAGTLKIFVRGNSGYCIIRPNPNTVNIDKSMSFSFTYIDHEIAEKMGVSPRILGIDSHSHQGKEPHIQMFQRHKNHRNISLGKGFGGDLDFIKAKNIFFEMVGIIITKYQRGEL